MQTYQHGTSEILLGDVVHGAEYPCNGNQLRLKVCAEDYRCLVSVSSGHQSAAHGPENKDAAVCGNIRAIADIAYYGQTVVSGVNLLAAPDIAGYGAASGRVCFRIGFAGFRAGTRSCCFLFRVFGIGILSGLFVFLRVPPAFGTGLR